MQPYWITLKGEEPFAFAGLWGRWDRAPDGNALETCTIITTGANEPECIEPVGRKRTTV